MTNNHRFAAIVLAAGQGTRMKSSRAKVLHEAGGRPLVAWPLHAAVDAGAEEIVVVVGHEREAVEARLREDFADHRLHTALQEQQLGTGHAVQIGLTQLSDYDGLVVILYGDCPLIQSATIRRLVRATGEAQSYLGLITGHLPDPTGYGRVLRDNTGRVIDIREHRDATAEELAIDEVNPGVYAVDGAFLRDAIHRLGSSNAQNEIYLTDLVALAARERPIVHVAGDMNELRGVNDRLELARCDQQLRRRRNEALARDGVSIRDLETTSIDPRTTVEADCTIEAGVQLRGACHIAAGAHIDVGAVLSDVRVDAGAYVKPYTVATESHIGANAQVGPFSHLRSGTELGEDCHVGNFVETKKTRLGRGSKANHLAYLGDGEIGAWVNIGAGTIFCNYDGFRKHVTILEDEVFIGSDSQLVAPIRVGKGAYVATGTTVTRDVPADALAVGRARQQNKEGYAARLKSRLKTKAKR